MKCKCGNEAEYYHATYRLHLCRECLEAVMRAINMPIEEDEKQNEKPHS